eukprot:CAMPEP_0170547202 /NCGR_PEP_ID=MMETSP0211-20121228/5553_1 /TAXON_ID=311385 /ORGANISM="Pseudokeronopsis sp., Strain OXSARD2" /LENGTH=109 /DNA_ID=CAMNT_0010852069 /DNA_START=470 /DNA_END=796 /DNA_ORIENTATION=-
MNWENYSSEEFEEAGQKQEMRMKKKGNMINAATILKEEENCYNLGPLFLEEDDAMMPGRKMGGVSPTMKVWAIMQRRIGAPKTVKGGMTGELSTTRFGESRSTTLCRST